MLLHRHTERNQSGFTLVELLIALAIGLLLLAGLSLVFVNSSEANRELQKSAQQIENGRYATDIMSQDLHHAGFYGHMYVVPTTPGALPDPCELADKTVLFNALALVVQGYQAPDNVTRASPPSCANLLQSSNLRPGSDVLVIRRASTNVLAVGGTVIQNEVYLQAIGTTGNVQIPGAGGTLLVGKNAEGAASTLFLKDGINAAPIRKYVVHIYFVAPCSVGTGTNGVCASTDDTIPTLKRLELVSESGATKMKIVPMVEGIEMLKIEYGVDNVPGAVNIATGLNGDSTADLYTGNPASVADWAAVIAAKVYVLARNTDQTGSFTDSKTYVLGAATITPTDLTTVDSNALKYKRHAYSTWIRMTNPAGRKEIP